LVKALVLTLISYGRMQRLIVLFALSVTVAFQNHIFLSKFGWLFLAILCGVHADFAIYATFFFSAFFISSGFFPDLFFTIKHFHIAIWLLVLVQFLKGHFLEALRKNLESATLFLIWIIILGVSTISAFSGEELVRVLRTNGNILIVLLSSFCLSCFVRRKDVLLNGLLFFVFGVCLRIGFAAFSHLKLPSFYPTENLLFNNHLGFLTSSSIFLLLPFVLTGYGRLKKTISWVLLVIVFSGLFLSCSRTGWLSFLLAFFSFSFFFFLIRKNRNASGLVYRVKWLFVGMILMFVSIISFFVSFNESVFERAYALKKLLDPLYWTYTLHDKENFGFLGFNRLRQFSIVGDILKDRWIAGIGFTHDVTDFHSLYLSILGGTGLIGLLLFLLFCGLWTSAIIKRIRESKDGLNSFRIAVLASFLVWLLYSFLETFIIQFNVWIILTIGILLQREWKSKHDLT